ncbi:MAG: hypothetical protein LBQ51_10895 [Desulfovibrio sp.]|jgi:hypothetical protein|nr:hypothetical protein [Desulfovibrio sp.]
MSDYKNNDTVFMIIFAGAPMEKRAFQLARAAFGGAESSGFVVLSFAGKH